MTETLKEETLESLLAEVQSRVRIAERQGHHNRSVPVELLRQIASALDSALEGPAGGAHRDALTQSLQSTGTSRLTELCETLREYDILDGVGYCVLPIPLAEEIASALAGIARQQSEKSEEEITRPSGAEETEQGSPSRPLRAIE